MSGLLEPLVIKFGGTSVGGGDRFVRAANIATEAASQRPVAVVVSAMSGVTNTLLGAARGSVREGAAEELRSSLSERHLAAAREAVSAEHLPEVEARLEALLDLLVEKIGAPVKSPAARKAEIAVFGERLSSVILSGAIRTSGTPSAIVVEDPIATGPAFSGSPVDTAGTERRCAVHVAPILADGAVAVVPGYVGRSPEGSPTTLGRGGSDLSATVIGRALGSTEVWIMTDVDGVLDADPRLVPEAALLTRLSYREAGTFASLGAKVLHPKTMEPAEEAGIEVSVRNSFAPERTGTRVTGFESGPGVRCVALRGKVPVEIPCTNGRPSEAAMVVCIGEPNAADLKHGLKVLRGAKIAPLHSGLASAGLVYLVNSEAGEAALRVLHDSLVTVAAAVEEVA